MDLKIKVCGLTAHENVKEIIQLQPDFIGFNFYKDSPRYVGSDFRIPDSNSMVIQVAVFVNEEIQKVIDISNQSHTRYVQLHGDESPEYCKTLFEMGFIIIKAFGVTPDFKFTNLSVYEPYVRFFLFDTKSENFGGTGKQWDWSLLEKYKGKKTFFVSGGIGLDNLEQILKIKHNKLIGIDINSKFENSPGVKDSVKVKTFMDKKNELRSE